MCECEKSKNLKCSLSNSWRSKILLCRFRWRCLIKLDCFLLGENEEEVSFICFNDCNNNLSLNNGLSDFGCHRVWWIWWYICSRKRLKLQEIRSSKLLERRYESLMEKQWFFVEISKIQRLILIHGANVRLETRSERWDSKVVSRCDGSILSMQRRGG